MDRRRSVNAVVDVAIAALSAPPGADPLHSVLRALQTAVGADAAGLYEHVRGGDTITVDVSPDEIWRRLPYTQLPTHIAAGLHPSIDHLLTNDPAQPFSVTDLVSERQWHNMKLAALMRPDWGRNYQMSIPVPGACHETRSSVWILGRTDSNFSVDDQLVCSWIQPILTVVTNHRANVTDDVDWTAQGLTQRELLIVSMVARDLSAPRIAAKLGISSRTVEKHKERAYRKMDIHSRYEAAQVLRQSRPTGIVPLDESGTRRHSR